MNYTLSGINQPAALDIIPDRVYNSVMNTIAEFIKQKRKEYGLTQEEFSIRSGLGLRFVRELEQGKTTVRMDKVNQALAMFGMEAVPGRKENEVIDWRGEHRMPRTIVPRFYHFSIIFLAYEQENRKIPLKKAVNEGRRVTVGADIRIARNQFVA